MSPAFVILVGLLALPPIRGPHDPRPEPTRDEADVCYWGVATAVTKDSITIRYKNWKPKTFPVSAVLARGDFQLYPRIGPGLRPYKPMESAMYRLTDVKVGDWVNIYYAHIDGKNICDHINIGKRPGGKIPPLPKEAEELLMPTIRDKFDPPYIPSHERVQAYWDVVDEGHAWPKKHGPLPICPQAPPPREKR